VANDAQVSRFDMVGAERERPTDGGFAVARVTMEDVAREAGVSRALVSIAFRDVPGVSAETKRQILDTAQRIGYRHNTVAARLASHRTNTIGLFIPDIRNTVIPDIYEGVREAADAASQQLVVAISGDDGDRDRAAIEELMGVQVDISVVPGCLLPSAELRELAKARPMVVATREVTGLDSVLSDPVRGSVLVVRHLVDLGHRRIAHIAPPEGNVFHYRADAYVEAMKKAGLEPDVRYCGYRQSDAAAAAGELLDEPHPPTAIFANNDVAALGVLDAMAARGLRAPDDLSVVGYDNTPTSALPGISLTSVDQQAHRMGRLAAETAVRRIQDPEAPAVVRILDPSLIVRASSGPPPK
jgi:DNA-binding LacI/PurR family transcriptional regulator